MRSRISRVRVSTGRPYPEVLAEAWAKHLAPRNPGAPTVVSTFAGCGGSSAGYSMAGFHELLAVEWDEQAAGTFAANFPGVPIYRGDIHDLSTEKVLNLCGLEAGALDVLDGSPPCQGFSTAGKRELGDKRNTLFEEFVRLLGGLRPRVFLMENVSGMVKGKMRLVFADAFRALEGEGYRVRCSLLNAAWFGVPQQRMRIVFLGTRSDTGVLPVYPVPRGHRFDVRSMLPEEFKGLRFLSWRNKARRDQLRPLGEIPVGIAGLGLDFEGRVKCDDPEVVKAFQSFPPGFALQGTKASRLKQIGNAVPPLMMRAIAETLRRKVLKK